MPAMKCPNPTCQFYFNPLLVPKGAVISCPDCALRFTLPPPSNPDPYAGSPIASDMQATLPIGSSIVTTPGPSGYEATPTTTRQDTTTNRRKHQPSKSGSGMLKVVLISALLTVVCVVPIAWIVYSNRNAGSREIANKEITVADKNFAFTYPPSPWKKDTDAQTELGVNAVAMTRTEAPTAGAAIHVIDFETRNPLASELREEMMKILNRAFLYVPADLAFEDAPWGPHTAKKAFFRGESKHSGTVTVGEVYVLVHKGLAYWFFTWTPEADAAASAAELTEVRSRFRLLNMRDKWKETVSNEQVFRSSKGTGRFKVSTFDRLWSEAPLDPTVEDPKAELLLKGVLKTRTQSDFNPTAQMVVMVLPNMDEAAGIAYLKKRWTKDVETFGPTTITELTGEPLGEALPNAPTTARLPVVRWKVSTGGNSASKSSEKLIVFTQTMIGGELVVAEGSSPWKEREVWERRLMDFAGSLQP